MITNYDLESAIKISIQIEYAWKFKVPVMLVDLPYRWLYVNSKCYCANDDHLMIVLQGKINSFCVCQHFIEKRIRDG